MFTNKELKKLIIPLIIEQFLAVTVGMVDVMMVSSVGEAAISGVSLVDMINNLINAVFAALATGGAVVTAQYIGAKKNKDGCESATQLILIAISISLAIMAFCLLFNKWILALFFGSIEADVMRNAMIYFAISAVSFPFLAIYNSAAALFRAMGNSKISMKVSLLMNVINILGNAILIYGFRMGVKGVAIPTLVGRAVAAIVLLVLIRNKNQVVHLSSLKGLHFNFKMIKKILYIGIPNGLESGIFQFGRVIVVSIIASFGTVQIAANAVANSIDNFGSMSGQAMSLAMITVIGQCVGAHDLEKIKSYTKKLLRISYIITAIVNVCILLLLPFILRIYNLSPETMKLAFILILIHNGLAIFLWPASFTLPNALRACNDVKYTMVISILSMCMFRIMFSFILGKWLGLGALGVWIAMILDWTFRVTCFVWRFVSGKWKRLCGFD